MCIRDRDTAADGIITGFCKINSDIVGDKKANAACIIYDYSVLAGTQGYFHHMKLDRLCEKYVSMDFRLSYLLKAAAEDQAILM